MTAPYLTSPDGDTWYLDQRAEPRIVRIHGGQLYRIDPVIESANGWYRAVEFRVADVGESQRLDLSVVHATREILRSTRGRFGFRTAYTLHFDGMVAAEMVAAPWDGSATDQPDFGALGAAFAAAWAPFAHRVPMELTTHPKQPTTTWRPSPPSHPPSPWTPRAAS
jgi:hypothetical protein